MVGWDEVRRELRDNRGRSWREEEREGQERMKVEERERREKGKGNERRRNGRN